MSTCTIEQKRGPGGLTLYALSDPSSGALCEVAPERGALCTRLRVGADEVLFMDEASLIDRGKNVRGGIPVLFPIAGKLPDERCTIDGREHSMKQHGFGRNSAWEVSATHADGASARLECRLASSAETRAQFPFDFDARLAFELRGRALALDFVVRNAGSRPMPLHYGYHPYFRLPDRDKARARIETGATRAFDNRTGQTGPFSGLDLCAEEVDLHLLDHRAPGTVLERGEGGPPVRLAWDPEFSHLVVWTLRGRDFVCVEPWTAPGGALARGEGLLPIEPGASKRLHVELRVD